ncbi:MAG TPA: diphthine--ammonia ligase [Cytophagaceae bacterium]|jgi:uncharacterized protein (TIGR00290 family)|nr:diphthine--ammonia ligase [Cytophagaceae bacterium]
MNQLPTAVFCWSGGKDSSFCLYQILTQKTFTVKYLLTTINDRYKRVSMHGIREELVDKQAESIGIPLLKMRVYEGSNKEYEQEMESILINLKSEGINHVIFGDIFLEDLRIYRENNLAKIGMTGIFPLWGMETTLLMYHFIKIGFKTITCCVNDGYLGQEWVGREIDSNFLKQLPLFVDPCGENGEYHSFCYDGPLFKNKINFSIGEKIYKTLDTKNEINTIPSTVVKTKGFWYCDLIPIQ